MTKLDVSYLALIAVGLSLDSFVVWPAFLRRSQEDPGRARVWLWSRTIGLLWLLVAGGVAVWQLEQRPWTTLRLVLPSEWGVFGTLGLLLAVAVFHIPTATKVIRGKRSGRRIRIHNDVGRRVPHTRAELAWFMALSMSAGICEEFVFRGYLIWVFQPILGLWGAAAASLVVFAAAHAYQGTKGVLAVGVVGGLLTLVVLMFGSLIPAMAVHASIDAVEGWLSWFALREVQVEGDGGSTPPSPYPAGGETVAMPR